MCEVVSCAVGNPTQANRIVDRLKTSGFSATDVSVLLPAELFQTTFTVDSLGRCTITDSPNTLIFRENAADDLERSTNRLTGIGMLAVPGVGPMVIAGPAIQTLSSVSNRDLRDDLSRTLISMGVPKTFARYWDKNVSNKYIFISVTAQNAIEVNVIVKTFEAVGATDIVTSFK